MYIAVLIATSILCGVVSVVSFFLYVRYRMRPRAEKEKANEEEKDTGSDNCELDRLEQRYQQIHFISLALFVLFGVLILVYLSHRYNPPRINY